MPDKYILIEGGLVQNDPGLDVINMDDLDTLSLEDLEQMMYTVRRLHLETPSGDTPLSDALRTLEDMVKEMRNRLNVGECENCYKQDVERFQIAGDANSAYYCEDCDRQWRQPAVIVDGGNAYRLGNKLGEMETTAVLADGTVEDNWYTVDPRGWDAEDLKRVLDIYARLQSLAN